APAYLSELYQVVNIGEITLGEETRNRMKNTQGRESERRQIINAACALLNSGGGLILMLPKNDNYTLSDGLGLDIELGLRELVRPQTIQDNFTYLQVDVYTIIFVKSWSADLISSGGVKARISSIDCQAYKRCGTSTLKIAPNEFYHFFNQKKLMVGRAQGLSPKRMRINNSQDKMLKVVKNFCNQKNIKISEAVEFGESEYTEFKSFEGRNLQTRLGENLVKYISAFGNTNGGFFITGIDDKTKKVVGCGKGIDPEFFKILMENTFKKLITIHFDNCSSQRSVEYNLHIINVIDDLETRHGYVMALEVKKHCCVIFSKNPESFKIEGGAITNMKPGEWLQMMMGTDPESAELCKNFEKELSMSLAPPQCKPVYGLKNTARLNMLQNALYPVKSEGIESIPAPLCSRLFEKFERFDDNLKPNGEQGVLIFSKSWAVDIEMEKNDNVICDALLFCTNSFPVLYTVVEKATEELLEYSRQTAYQIKQKLVNVGGYSDWICVIPKLFELPSRTVISSETNCPGFKLKNQYPEDYRIFDVKAILRSLVLVMLSFKSPLSDQLGCEFLNLLTIEQFEILNSKCNIEDFSSMFVHGLPGTGKTVIAEMLIRRIQRTFHCRPEEVLYICENQPLRDYIFVNLRFLTFRLKHIVVDEAHNFRGEEPNWYSKAISIIYRASDACGPGVFWVFLDYFQLHHPYSNGLPGVEYQRPKVDLTFCVRNSKAIYGVMYEEMTKIVEGSFLKNQKNVHALCRKQMNVAKCGHSFQGVSKVIHFKNGEDLTIEIFKEIKAKLKQGYTNKDFAILCNKQADYERYYAALVPLFKKVRPPPSFSQAHAVHENKIILDTVRRFSGLERNIVFVVHPEVHEKHKDLQDNLILNAVSRARVQLFIFTPDKLAQLVAWPTD
uniref:Schlafen family member 11 n=1 Tax=Erpetoichthys calabaricus TaxID=27687 RepID=A0A8C4SXD9_ERPCA